MATSSLTKWWIRHPDPALELSRRLAQDALRNPSERGKKSGRHDLSRSTVRVPIG
jgi:hypothetical protein